MKQALLIILIACVAMIAAHFARQGHTDPPRTNGIDRFLW